ncbi:MAG: SWF/SNF helicase family protein, partial [Deltaproteobacteria bacterium]|nr:SWF/SNF helicase family protein [Deltaproteobacteria bacterium]
PRLKGFCRTNLFKRLESSGHSFLLSIERHILRNHVYLYAIENGKPLPIGTQDSGLLDTRLNDEDSVIDKELLDESENEIEEETEDLTDLGISSIIEKRAAEAYQRYETHGRKRFKWLRPDLFNETLAKHLREDAESLREILENNVDWDPTGDAKLNALHALLVQEHPDDKILVFSQFADTVRYLNEEMESRGVTRIKGVTGDSSDPTGIAWRFSPESNEKREIIPPDKELRVVIATDVLSEGQNLQDCFIVVNYDLPWAIIRLIQRVGRVDRIGQKSEKIIAYTFLPADGVESIIRLRARVRKRLQENAEVVGADEAFFEDEMSEQTIRDLFTEKSGILDGETDTEVDLASYAYQIWKNAVTSNPKLEKTITELQPVVYSTKPHEPSSTSPEGVIVYLRTAEDNDALVWMDRNGKVVTESQKTILDALKCSPETPALQRLDAHHELVRKGVDQVLKEEKSAGGQLGRPSGARFRTYERLKQYAEEVKGSLFDIQELHRAAEEIYKFPLRESAKDALNRLLRAHASNEDIARKVLELRDAGALTIMSEQIEMREPLIICSMGLSAGKEEKEE